MAPNSQSFLSFSYHCCPLADIPQGWALFPLPPVCDVAEEAKPAQVGMELPLSRSRGTGWREASLFVLSSLTSLLEVWRSFRSGLVVAKHTQCIKWLPKPPAAMLSSGVLCAGARGYRDERRLLVGTKEAESRPLKASRTVLVPGGWAGRLAQEGCAGWRALKVQKPKGHRGQGMSWVWGLSGREMIPGGRVAQM